MPRAIWRGALSFGLVNIPVKLYSATEQKDVRFHEFDQRTKKRIRHKRVREGSNREVGYDDIVKGYEASKGEYVMVTQKELEAVEPGRSRTIEIEAFVDLDAIDPIYFEKTYYLAPAGDAGAEKPYRLLAKSIKDSGRVAVARFVLRSKQYLAAIRPMDGVLALETLYFHDEVRSTKDIDNLPAGDGKVSAQELRIANQLIDSLSKEWDPTDYEDTYRARVLKLVRDKAKGKAIVQAEPEQAPQVADLMEALRASIAAAKGGKMPARRSSGQIGGSRRSSTTKRTIRVRGTAGSRIRRRRTTSRSRAKAKAS
jgi:DNA end-binding protein Ku